jgi:hypothetical protein
VNRKILGFLLALFVLIGLIAVTACGTAGAGDANNDSALPEIALELVKIRADQYVTEKCADASPTECASKRQFVRQLIDHFVNVSQGGPLITDEMRSQARARVVDYIVANSKTVTPELAELLVDEIERLARKKT